MSSDRVLVADHDPKSINLLRQILTAGKYEVLVANNLDRALQVITEDHPQFLLTDFCLQKESDGIELIKRLREFSDLPVLVLSANTDTSSILQGFEVGADDYLAKPFDAKILLARMKAVLNRCHKIPSSPEIIHCQNLSINPVSREVTVNGVPVYLTETEYNLLIELARHQDQVMLHEQLLMAVWGPQYSSEMDYLRSYIHILRRKLEGNSLKPSLIISLSGIGYKLVSTPPESTGK